MPNRNRIVFWTVVGGFLILLAAWAFWPRAVDVDIVEVERGEIQVTVGEEGETRVRDVFEVLAPVGGRLERIALDAGDCVRGGETIVAKIRPAPAPILDARSEAQLKAAADAAVAGVEAAKADLVRLGAEATRAEADAERFRRLAADSFVSKQALDRAEMEIAALSAAVKAGAAVLAMRRQELAAARAALRPSGAGGDGEFVDVVAPISGVVLRRLRESEGPVGQGAPLAEIGDPDALEIVVDLLSEDAVQVSPGDIATLSDWGGPNLTGRVRLVEPFAFTKVSALGIEEQRVNVLIDLDHDVPSDRLGHGYRVDVAVEVWRDDDAIVAPMTALFKENGIWAAYRLDGGRARLVGFNAGRMNGLSAQVLDGLDPGDQLVEHPSGKIRDGVRIAPRQRPETLVEPDQSPDVASAASIGESTRENCDGVLDEAGLASPKPDAAAVELADRR